MGLSERKVKQRIGNDPRNLSWVDDAARFGSNYLSRFGWDTTKGLGVNADGRTSHIKVAQKLDMLGIGAANQTDPNGLAWKQNKDFENLLRRLNQSSEAPEEDQGTAVVEGFVKPTVEVDGNGNGALDPGESKKKKKKEKKERKEEKNSEKKERKRKRDKEANESANESEKKKRKSGDDKASSAPTSPVESTSKPAQQITHTIPRHRSHRARHIAAKSIGSKSAAAISEILGIAPTPSPFSSATPSGTQTPQESKLTPIYDDINDISEVDKVTTSTKSLQDYFKEKMGKLKGPNNSVASTSLQSETVGADYDDIPRCGLGSRTKRELDKDVAERIGPAKVSGWPFMAATTLTSVSNVEEDSLSGDKNRGADKAEERRQRKKEKKAAKLSRKERKRQEDKEEQKQAECSD